MKKNLINKAMKKFASVFYVEILINNMKLTRPSTENIIN